ncbi:hypothetical protein D8B34_05585 [Verminephrobacter eiseniae]|nr:hypothetical protein [Verminephrobacter eiseniae]MCW5293608.1 hypothetical protein [Verminephrobacter eiseniae]MCW8184264.1 hypothetical protein [Verminephrobacter eiseniae]MCW8224051.1 hypothetical protein [Verminephrobacter eiseniae]MCW8233279.1 hypothetical protein [Verminephrobacter eiseniae]
MPAGRSAAAPALRAMRHPVSTPRRFAKQRCATRPPEGDHSAAEGEGTPVHPLAVGQCRRFRRHGVRAGRFSPGVLRAIAPSGVPNGDARCPGAAV